MAAIAKPARPALARALGDVHFPEASVASVGRKSGSAFRHFRQRRSPVSSGSALPPIHPDRAPCPRIDETTNTAIVRQASEYALETGGMRFRSSALRLLSQDEASTTTILSDGGLPGQLLTFYNYAI